MYTHSQKPQGQRVHQVCFPLSSQSIEPSVVLTCLPMNNWVLTLGTSGNSTFVNSSVTYILPLLSAAAFLVDDHRSCCLEILHYVFITELGLAPFKHCDSVCICGYILSRTAAFWLRPLGVFFVLFFFPSSSLLLILDARFLLRGHFIRRSYGWGMSPDFLGSPCRGVDQPRSPTASHPTLSSAAGDCLGMKQHCTLWGCIQPVMMLTQCAWFPSCLLGEVCPCLPLNARTTKR